MKGDKYQKSLTENQVRAIIQTQDIRFTQIYKALYGDAMLVFPLSGTRRPETPKKSVFEFCYKKVNSSLENLIKILKSNSYCETRTVQIETSQKIGNSF